MLEIIRCWRFEPAEKGCCSWCSELYQCTHLASTRPCLAIMGAANSLIPSRGSNTACHIETRTQNYRQKHCPGTEARFRMSTVLSCAWNTLEPT
jgi:hypothetical protein